MQSCCASCWLTLAQMRHVWRRTGKSSGFASQQLLCAQITQQAPFGSTLLSPPHSLWLRVSFGLYIWLLERRVFSRQKIKQKNINERNIRKTFHGASHTFLFLLAFSGVLCPFPRAWWPQNPNLSLLSWGHFLVWLLNTVICVGCWLL